MVEIQKKKGEEVLNRSRFATSQKAFGRKISEKRRSDKTIKDALHTTPAGEIKSQHSGFT